MKRHILVVVNSMNMGGPQKSLVGFLQRVDPEDFAVDLLVLQGEPYGPLITAIPPAVNVLPAPASYRAATLPKGELVTSLARLLPRLPSSAKAAVLFTILTGAAMRQPGTRIRQKVWSHAGPFLPKLERTYDAAIGILGQSTYAVVDLSSALHKYHWVRSDSRILRRNEEVESRYFYRLSGALSVSSSCADIFEEMYPFMRGRTRVYKNDIPGQASRPRIAGGRFTRTGAALRLLTVTRLDSLKGLDLAIDAARSLRERGVLFEWVILGDGPERKRLERASGDLYPSLRFQGMEQNTDSWLDETDIYVHPSLSEGRSNAVEEARAAGKAILACNYPTVGDQVEDGVNGLVCEMSGIALADHIEFLGEAPGERLRLGQAAAVQYKEERDDPNVVLDLMCSGKICLENRSR